MVKSKIFDKPIIRIGIILFILLVGISLRLHNLGTFSLWFDEALGILQAENIKATIIDKCTIPPLYTFFLHAWNRITDSEFGLRLPSVISGSFSILTIYIIGRLLFTEKVGLISAFLLAVSPFHVYYSQEARMYSMMPLLTLLSLYFLIRSLNNRSTLFWMGYVVFSILNIYCHYIGLFTWLALIIFFALVCKGSDKIIRRRWLVSNLLISLFVLPWLLFLFVPIGRYLRVAENCYWIPIWPPPVSIKSLFMTFKNFSIGYNATMAVYLPATLLSIFLFVRVIFKTKNQKNLILSLLCLSLPILVLFIISRVKPLYVDRYFIASSIFYYLIIAGGLSSLNKRWLALSLSAIFILSMFSLKNYYNNWLPYSFEERVGVQKKKAHRTATEYIYNRFKQGDGVYHTCRNTIFPFIYYFNKFNGRFPKQRDSGISLSMEDNRVVAFEFDIFGRRLPGSDDVTPDNRERFWLIFSTWDFENIRPEDPERMTVKWLDDNYKNLDYKEFDGITLYLYERKI